MSRSSTLAAHLERIGQGDAGQELEVHVEGAFVHDRHELRPQARDEGQRPAEERDGDDDEDGLVAEPPAQEREIDFSGGLDDNDPFSPFGV